MVPDPALAACVAAAAGLPDATADTADADLASIEQLHCAGGASAPEVIRSLDGVQALTSLSVLDVPRNQITDLGRWPRSPGSGLLVLDVFGNRIADVRGLAGAPPLQELQLGANPVTDLTPLLAVGTLVNLGLDETDPTRPAGVDQLRAAGISVNGLA